MERIVASVLQRVTRSPQVKSPRDKVVPLPDSPRNKYT